MTTFTPKFTITNRITAAITRIGRLARDFKNEGGLAEWLYRVCGEKRKTP